MSPVFYDTHCHLDYPDFAADAAGVVERAQAAGVTRLIAMGTDLDSSRSAVALAARFPAVYAAVGWHPGHATEAPDDIREPLRALARQPKVVAIGETGLDHYRLPQGAAAEAERERIQRKQRTLFEQQLEVAVELGLNCVVHQRNCWAATLEAFAPFACRVRAVFHCFVDGPAELDQVLALGSLVSFTGIVTFKNSHTVRQSVAAVPDGRFMIETDSPFLAPVPYRGKRCEPAYVRHTAETVAQVRDCSLEALSASTCATAEAFFRGLEVGR